MHHGFERLQLFLTKVFKDYRYFWSSVSVCSRLKFLYLVQRKLLLLQSDVILDRYSMLCNTSLLLEVYFLFSYFRHKCVFLKYSKAAVFSCQGKWEKRSSQYLHLYSIFSQRRQKQFENTKLPKIQGIFSKRLCDIWRSVTSYTGDVATNLWPPGFTRERKLGKMENSLSH